MYCTLKVLWWCIVVSKLYSLSQNNHRYGSMSSHTLVSSSRLFSLQSIRDNLALQESAIIYGLFARSRFLANLDVYKVKRTQFLDSCGRELTSIEWAMLQTNQIYDHVHRCSPVVCSASAFEKTVLPLNDSLINMDCEMLTAYPSSILNRICSSGDDGQHSGSISCDVPLLKALSRRVHTGKLVAELKFIEDSAMYAQLVHSRNTVGIIEKLTNVAVENAVLGKVLQKAEAMYGACGNNEVHYLHPEIVVDIYRDFIIPLTKDAEVRYLYHRVGIEPPELSMYRDFLVRNIS